MRVSRTGWGSADSEWDTFPPGVIGPMLPPAWLLYRNGFVVLQHLYTLAQGRAGLAIPWPRLMRELGYVPEQAAGLIDYLVVNGYVRYHPGKRRISLTPYAVDYLEQRHGRRYSVRPRAA